MFSIPEECETPRLTEIHPGYAIRTGISLLIAFFKIILKWVYYFKQIIKNSNKSFNYKIEIKVHQSNIKNTFFVP